MKKNNRFTLYLSRKSISNLKHKTMKNKKRYFLVSSVSGSPIGNLYAINSVKTNGSYLSCKTFVDMFEQKNDDITKGSTVITNIIEVNKQDYNDFNS